MEDPTPREHKRQDDSLADVPPTPVPDDHAEAVADWAACLLVLAAAGCGAFFVVANALTPTLGATRSSQLKWQQRQHQIEQAERDVQATIDQRQ